MTTGQIYKYVWNDSPDNKDPEHTVTQTINKIRELITNVVCDDGGIANKFITTEIGVGYVSDGNYWTQMFIGK